MSQPNQRVAVAMLVLALGGSQQLLEQTCDRTDPSSCNSLLAAAPSWSSWLSGRDTRVSTHFLDLLELLTRNSGSRGGKR
ncbi:MAG: hypothetical protein II007_01435 [Gammaproteobacteria bacterium]|nr:hypothetical protein [Gammaproteobacteria bacterium]